MELTIEQKRALAIAEAKLKAAKSQPSVLGDVVKSIGSGLVTGTEALIGLPGDIQRGIGSAGEWASEKLFGAPDPQTKAEMASIANPIIPSTAGIQEAVKNTTGFTPHKPQTTLGAFANTGAEFLPGGALTRTVGGALRYGLAPGLASEGAGQLTEGTAAEPYARVGAALLAPSVARRAITPFPASPERTVAANVLRNEGVDLTAGQRTGSQKLRYTESELGGHSGAAMMDRQAEQFTAAALRRVGENANRATPEVIDRAFTRIGGEFTRLGANNQVQFDAQFNRDMLDALTEYDNLVSPSMRAPVVHNVAQDIAGAVQANRTMPGDVYNAMRSRLETRARGARNDPQLAEALRGFREALDDAMERSLAANNPNDLGAWREARRQYRDMLAIEKAATAAGENAAMGLISPSALRNATVSSHGRRNYARGQGDFAELARAGESLMKPLPQSGTAPRTAARQILNFGPALVGASADMATGGPGWVGGLFGLAAPFALGRAIMSRPGRAYLGNNLIPAQATPNADQLAAMLANTTLPLRQ